MGTESTRRVCRRAVALERSDKLTRQLPLRASANNARLPAPAGRLDEASRERMSAVRCRSIDCGAETDLIFVAVFAALIEIWRGKFTDADNSRRGDRRSARSTSEATTCG